MNSTSKSERLGSVEAEKGSGTHRRSRQEYEERTAILVLQCEQCKVDTQRMRQQECYSVCRIRWTHRGRDNKNVMRGQLSGLGVLQCAQGKVDTDTKTPDQLEDDKQS